MIGMRARKPSPPAPDRRTSLGGIPVLEPEVSIETAAPAGGGLVLVSRRARRGGGWLARFAPPVLERRVELDELGAFVVRLFDGERDVAAIAAAFAERFKVCRREAELCTANFIKRLAQRRMVAIAMRS